MACAVLQNGFDVLVKAPPGNVAAVVTHLENLPLWDPGCTDAVALDSHNYIIHDASFQQKIWYTVKASGPSFVKVTGRGRSFTTREIIAVRPHERELMWCYVRYKVEVSLKIPYCLCSPCVELKLQRASRDAAEGMRALFEREEPGEETDELMIFHCEL